MKNLLNFAVPEDNKVCDLFMASVAKACVTVADEVGIFSSFSDNGNTTESIARSLNANEEAIDCIIRVLTAYGYLNFSNDLYFLEDFVKAYFVRSSPIYRGFQFSSRKEFWHEKILGTIKEGWSPIGADGKPFTAMWEEGTLSQQAAERFTGMMHTNISGPCIGVVKSGVFEQFDHVVDVGGGSGVLLSALRQLYPGKKLTLFELPQVCESAKKIVSRYVDPDSINFHGGNWFVDPISIEADAFFLSNVLHDWPMQKSLKILQNFKENMPSNAELFIFECLLDENKLSPKHTVAYDLLMYANHQSKQFTLNELTELLVEAGFSTPETIMGFGYYSLLKTTKSIA